MNFSLRFSFPIYVELWTVECYVVIRTKLFHYPHKIKKKRNWTLILMAYNLNKWFNNIRFLLKFSNNQAGICLTGVRVLWAASRELEMNKDRSIS